MSNHLAGRGSRYLLQHADNPVEWYPWSSEPFERAAREGKPLLVSIGYSSCHWCHVMAHESFQDEATAELMNERFVAIKVDKEEVPDVDGFYMEFLTRLSGRGGWPLNVFVNPKQAPFYGVTYLPNAQFRELLVYVAEEYAKRPEMREAAIDKVFAIGGLDPETVRSRMEGVSLVPPVVRQGAQFPQALFLSFALKRGERDYVAQELDNLVAKGLFDHIEGGWFRYSVDPDFKIPHFEKMLYDQAGLLALCAESYDLRPELCGYAISMTARWLQSHMKLPSGLYGSATDADTPDGEGFYYTEEESADQAERRLFRLDECGVHEGRYLPWLDFEAYRADPEGAERLVVARRAGRKARLPPALDAKAVVSWNCFLGHALLRCAERLESDELDSMAVELARSLAPFAKGPIPHVVYGRQPLASSDYLEDYAAYLLFASDLKRSGRAAPPDSLLQEIRRRFFRGGYLFHSSETRFESLSLWQDAPTPSGGSMLLTALLDLGENDLMGLDRLAIVELAAENPAFFGLWCSAFDRLSAHP